MKTLPATAIGDADVGLAWSAFDPLHENIDSDDPLGFGGAVLYLADQLVPGLNVRTTRLRYYSMLCGGLQLIGERDALADDTRRRELFLRWEKLWALAQPETNGLLGALGVRRYVGANGNRPAWLDDRFQILSNQAFGGALGAYKTSCEALGLLERGELRLTASGEQVAGAFWRSVAHRKKLRGAVWKSMRGKREKPDPYRLDGFRSVVARLGLDHVSVPEQVLLGSLIVEDDLRATTLAMAAPGLRRGGDYEGLRAIRQAPAKTDVEKSRREAAVAALALDGFICQANFVLDRLVDEAHARSLTVQAFVAEQVDWPTVEARLRITAKRAAAQLSGPQVLVEAAGFCAGVATLQGTPLLSALIARHDEVMRTRRARRWLVLDAGKVVPERYPQNVRRPEKIRHAYRLEPLAMLADQAGRL